jgi:hypothetical protein
MLTDPGKPVLKFVFDFPRIALAFSRAARTASFFQGLQRTSQGRAC